MCITRIEPGSPTFWIPTVMCILLYINFVDESSGPSRAVAWQPKKKAEKMPLRPGLPVVVFCRLLRALRQRTCHGVGLFDKVVHPKGGR